MAAPVRKIIVSPKRRGDALDQDSSAILFWRRLNVADFAAASTTGNLDLTGFPGGLTIEGAFLVNVVDWAGGGAASATLSVGTTGTADAYVAATSVFTGVGNVAIVGKTIVPGTFLGGAATPLASGTVRVALVSSVNTNLMTAGKADLYIRLRAVSARNS